MFTADFIRQCADPGIEMPIAVRFVGEIGASDALSVSITVGNRTILPPPPTTRDEAMALIGHFVGQAVVRVGVTQYPAGLGITNVTELKPDLVDACANIRMGTGLFGKVYRIMLHRYGAPDAEAFDAAISAWRTGSFEGRYVFGEPDPGPPSAAAALVNDAESGDGAQHPVADPTPSMVSDGDADPALAPADPNNAGIRVDLSGIGVPGNAE